MLEARDDKDRTATGPTLDAVARAVQRLEARVAALERRIARHGETPSPLTGEATSQPAPAAPAEPEPELEAVIAERLPLSAILSLVGQVCLILCGAFFLRALTDNEVLPLRLGLTLGFVYALAWLGVTRILARRGNILAASFYGASSAAVALPLIWEMATRFEVVAAPGAAVLIGVVTLPALALAWRHDLAVVAWLFALAAVVASFALMIALRSVEPLAALLLVIGAATSWLAHTRDWGGLHWPIALAVDIYVLVMLFLVGRAGPESRWVLSTPAVVALALALLIVYLASFVGQILLRHREVSLFEIVQTGAALLVGFGGAARVARATDTGTAPLAAGALIVGLACYAVAFAQTKLRWEHRRNFMFYAWLAFVLSLSGCYLAAEGFAVLAAWCALAVAGAVLGARYRRVTLHYHAAAYLIAAAYFSGLAVAAFEFFGLPADAPWPGLGFHALLALSTAIASYLVVGFSGVDPRRPRSSRIPRLLMAAVAVLGCGGALVNLIVNGLGSSPPDASPSTVAATRTVVLAASAVALATTARLTALLELRWIVYPVLLIGGLKLLVEDLQNSTPAALFVAFGAYGLSLILSPRLLRRTDRAAAAPEREQDGADEVVESPDRD